MSQVTLRSLMPDKRYISVEEMADIVRKVLDKEFGITETEPAPRPEPVRPRTRQLQKPFLVTLQMVEDYHRLGKDLLIPSRHIITPSAKDAINQFGVKVQIESNSSTSPDDKLTRVSLWSDRYSRDLAHNLVDMFSDDVTTNELPSDGNLSEPVRYLNSDGKAVAIIISETGAELGIRLNKYAGVRAVYAESSDTVKAARERAAANCLVISAQQTSLLRARQLINVFLGAGNK